MAERHIRNCATALGATSNSLQEKKPKEVVATGKA
jgi:hypothetical protein